VTVSTLHHVTDALIAMLDAALPASVAVGDGEAPGKAGQAHTYPYVVVYSIAGGGPSGDAAHPAAMAETVYQVSSVSDERWEAEWAAGLVRQAVLGRTAGTGAFVRPIDGYTVNGGAKTLTGDDGLVVWHRGFDSGGGLIQEGRLSNVADRYVLSVAPHTA